MFPFLIPDFFLIFWHFIFKKVYNWEHVALFFSSVKALWYPKQQLMNFKRFLLDKPLTLRVVTVSPSLLFSRKQRAVCDRCRSYHKLTSSCISSCWYQTGQNSCKGRHACLRALFQKIEMFTEPKQTSQLSPNNSEAPESLASCWEQQPDTHAD